MEIEAKTLRYEPPTHTFRFFFSDGEVVDVIAIQDDSNLRGWMLDQHFGQKRAKTDEFMIAGVVRLADQGQLGEGSDGRC